MSSNKKFLFDSFIPPNKFYKQCSRVWQGSTKCKKITNEGYQQACVQVISSNVCSVSLGLLEAYTLKFQQ
jgi:hypothetical protein